MLHVVAVGLAEEGIEVAASESLCTMLVGELTDPLDNTPDPMISPERIRPFPKAPTRNNTGGRKKRKSAVLTDTSEKNAIEE